MVVNPLFRVALTESNLMEFFRRIRNLPQRNYNLTCIFVVFMHTHNWAAVIHTILMIFPIAAIVLAYLLILQPCRPFVGKYPTFYAVRFAEWVQIFWQKR